jgi:hypothetical protein
MEPGVGLLLGCHLTFSAIPLDSHRVEFSHSVHCCSPRWKIKQFFPCIHFATNPNYLSLIRKNSAVGKSLYNLLCYGLLEKAVGIMGMYQEIIYIRISRVPLPASFMMGSGQHSIVEFSRHICRKTFPSWGYIGHCAQGTPKHIP